MRLFDDRLAKGVLVMALWISLIASNVWAQERGFVQSASPRVAGIAITNVEQAPNGDGKDVELTVEITMSTVQRVRPAGGSEITGRGDPVFDTTTVSSSVYAAQLGENYSLYRRGGLSNYTFTSFYGTQVGYHTTFDPPFTSYYVAQGTRLGRQRTDRLTHQGELPGISFGDGQTVDFTSLSTIFDTSTQLVPGGARGGGPDRRRTFRRWRGTFSHTYADQNAYTVRVASQCCGRFPAVEERGGGPNTFSTIFTGNLTTATNPGALSVDILDRRTTRFQSAQILNTFTYGRATRGVETTLTGTFADTLDRVILTADTDLPTFRRPTFNQVTAMAEIPFGSGENVLEIPTAGAWGLSALALLLAGVGWSVLRRS